MGFETMLAVDPIGRSGCLALLCVRTQFSKDEVAVFYWLGLMVGYLCID
jgi:hypothetical protein